MDLDPLFEDRLMPYLYGCNVTTKIILIKAKISKIN